MPLDPDVIALSYNDLVFKFGRSAVIATKSVIWDQAGAYTGWLASEAACELISDDSDDKVGSGAATLIRIVGQGNDGLEITEDVIPNGDTGAVALANDYKIIYRAWVVSSEDADPLTGGNHGTITIRKTAGPVTMAKILPIFGSTLMCIYRVPSNRYGELIKGHFSCNEGKGVVVEVKTRKDMTDENGWYTRMTFDAFENEVVQDLKASPIFLHPGTDIVAIASTAPAATFISGHFTIRLKPLVSSSVI